MIADQWYPLLQSSKLGRKPVGVRRMGERLVLWRDGDGRPVCMRDRCPHRGVALSRGRVRDGALECGYHGFRYGRDGQYLRMPCEGEDARIPAGLRAHTLPVEERYGLVWLFWGHADERPEIPWFDFIGERRRGTAEAAIEWPQNYVRTLESNFDLHHTPWLHGSIVPVGTRLDPFEVETSGTRISARGELRRPGKRSGMAFRVEFVAPSATYIELTKRVYLVNVDCPIDEQNTWRFVRYYQDYLSVPGLDRLLAWLALQLEWRIVQFRQDLPMVATQEPRLPDRNEDHLVRADAGTAAYLKLRRKLISQAKRRADAGPDLREARRDRVSDLQPAREPERHQPADDGAARGGLARLPR